MLVGGGVRLGVVVLGALRGGVVGAPEAALVGPGRLMCVGAVHSRTPVPPAVVEISDGNGAAAIEVLRAVVAAAAVEVWRPGIGAASGVVSHTAPSSPATMLALIAAAARGREGPGMSVPSQVR